MPFWPQYILYHHTQIFFLLSLQYYFLSHRAAPTLNHSFTHSCPIFNQLRSSSSHAASTLPAKSLPTPSTHVLIRTLLQWFDTAMNTSTTEAGEVTITSRYERIGSLWLARILRGSCLPFLCVDLNLLQGPAERLCICLSCVLVSIFSKALLSDSAYMVSLLTFSTYG